MPLRIEIAPDCLSWIRSLAEEGISLTISTLMLRWQSTSSTSRAWRRSSNFRTRRKLAV